MARLKVFHSGQFHSQAEVDPTRELLVGRGETCDLVLPPEAGVSRQHFRLRFAEGNWIVEVLSRYGELYRNGEKQSIFPVRNGATFSVPPYEFVFENEDEALAPEDSAISATSDEHDEDKTHIGYLPSIAFLRLTDQRGQSVQSYRLEGQAWIGGRDTSCSIFIDNPRISRRQFEIQKQDENYFIRDMGSINVTLLNGRPLSAEEWTPIGSSDAITVGDWTLQFELRDANFEQRLSEVDPELMMPAHYQEKTNGGAARSPFEDRGMNGAASAQNFGPGVGLGNFEAPPPPDEKKGMKLFGKHIPGLNPVRLAMVVMILVALGYGLFGMDDDKPAEVAKVQTPFDKLPLDKQQMVKQLYVTAQSLLAQGRYELARQEVIKLHQIIPYYEDSKQIEETANQGLAMMQEREKAEAEERQKAMVEEKIQRQVAECRAQLTPDATSAWADNCLSPVMEFNPEHPAIIRLKVEVEQMVAMRMHKEAQQKEYQERVAALRALFAKAQKVEQTSPPIPAIAAYERVVVSKLPDPGDLRGKAKRQIASLNDIMLNKQIEAEQKAESFYKAGNLKQAILTLREGLVVNPDNEVLKGRMSQYAGELRKQMMSYYQEAVLEESVGEVESAKTKWRKIRELSLPGEDYFEKATMRLKKYGAI